MTPAGAAILGLLPLLVLRLHGTEIERPLVIVMIGGLVTSTLFTLFALPTFYAFVHHLQEGKTVDVGDDSFESDDELLEHIRQTRGRLDGELYIVELQEGRKMVYRVRFKNGK